MLGINGILKGVELPDDYKNEEAIREYRRTGDISIKQEIATNNIPLVLNIAKKYFFLGVINDDVVSYGFIGLLEAIEKFDINCNNKFVTYAHNVISTTILNNINLEYGHNSKYYGAYINKYKQYFYKFYGTTREIFDERCMNEVLDEMIEDKIIDEELKERLIVGISLLNTYGEVTEEIEKVECEEEEPIVSIEDEYMKKHLDRILDILYDDEKKLIIRRYGLKGEKPHTLRELAKEYNTTFQTMDNRIQKCLTKLGGRVSVIK